MGADGDNWAEMPDPSAKAVPRRGRLLIVAAFAVFLFGLCYLVVEVATQEPGAEVVELQGVNDAQRIFGGVPQEGERVGSSNAPVTIQVFNDLQCADCREDFLTTIPTLVEDYARPGDAKLLWRHYSNSESIYQLGFYGAEAAAELGYGWNYVYLFFRNQGEARSFGVDQDFLDTIATGIEQMDFAEWKRGLEEKGGPEGPITGRLDADEELARGLGIRARQAVIVSGPGGSATLQDAPSLARIERAIARVE